jgi:predicted nucleic acid-binding protein
MDTNIWLYGLTSSQIATEQAKHAAAVALLEQHCFKHDIRTGRACK